MTSTRHPAGAVLLAVLLAATHAAPAEAQVVRLPDRDGPLAGTPTPVYSVGVEEGESWEMLSNVRSLVFDRDDNLYVLDGGSQRVLMFDARGRFIRQIGKKGEGPGELSFPSAIALDRGGNLYVYDPLRQGYSVFRTADGTYVRSIRNDEGFSLTAGRGIAAHPGGGMLSVMRPSLRRSMEAGGTVNATSNTVPLMLDPLDGSAPRKVFDVPQTWSTTTRDGGSTQARQVRMVTMQGPPTFSPDVLWGLLPDGNVALSFTPGYTVRIVEMNGRTLRYLQRAIRPRPVTEADRELAQKEREENMRSGRGVVRMQVGGGTGGGGAPPPNVSLPPMEFADSMAVLRGMVVSPSGRIWLGRTGPRWSDPGPVDIITAQGEYLGTLPPQRLPAAISASGLAAWIERDELDVERVVVKRLPDAWR